jgi:hypothetical protein
VAPAVLRRPHLWLAAVRSARQFVPSRWYRRPPFLPLPAPGYLAFRLETMYGRSDHQPHPADLVRWLAWCRAQNAYRQPG